MVQARESDRTVSAIISLETGKLTAGISTLDSCRFPCWGIAQPDLSSRPICSPLVPVLLLTP